MVTTERPHVTHHGIAFVSKFSTATAVGFFVLGAARDRAVRVDDERAGTGRHAARTYRGGETQNGRSGAVVQLLVSLHARVPPGGWKFAQR
jgi:hypothetical protein